MPIPGYQSDRCIADKRRITPKFTKVHLEDDSVFDWEQRSRPPENNPREGPGKARDFEYFADLTITLLEIFTIGPGASRLELLTL